MADNVLAMTLRMRNTAVTTQRNLRSEIDRTGVSAQKFGTKFGKAVKASRTSVGGLMGSMISLKTIIIATFAYRAIQRFGQFIKSLTGLYVEQVSVTTKLGQAMASLGNYSREGLVMLKAYAQTLQEVTGISNETVEANMALLASYGQTAEEIRSTILPVIDLSIAKQIELQAATTLVGKAFVGETGTLSRYGIIIEKNLTGVEKWLAVQEKLTMHQQMAIKFGESYAGKVNILTEAYNDWKKGLGGVIAKGLEASGTLKWMNEVVKNQIAWLKEYEPLLVNIAAEGFVKFREGMKSMHETITSYGGDIIAWAVTFGNAISMTMKTVFLFFRLITMGVKIASTGLTVLLLQFRAIGEVLKGNNELARKFDEEAEKIKESMFGGDKMDEWIKESDKAWKTWWEGVKKDAADIGNIWSETTGGQAKYTTELSAINAKMAEYLKTQEQQFKNQQQINAEQEKTIELTKSMAQQFAMATRLEQEQTKSLLERVTTIGQEDVAGLTVAEKKLISKQGILKESFSELFGEYAQDVLGIEATYLKGDVNAKVEIDLTDDAKKLIEVHSINNVNVENRNIERLAN